MLNCIYTYTHADGGGARRTWVKALRRGMYIRIAYYTVYIIYIYIYYTSYIHDIYVCTVQCILYKYLILIIIYSYDMYILYDIQFVKAFTAGFLALRANAESLIANLQVYNLYYTLLVYIILHRHLLHLYYILTYVYLVFTIAFIHVCNILHLHAILTHLTLVYTYTRIHTGASSQLSLPLLPR